MDLKVESLQVQSVAKSNMLSSAILKVGFIFYHFQFCFNLNAREIKLKKILCGKYCLYDYLFTEFLTRINH